MGDRVWGGLTGQFEKETPHAAAAAVTEGMGVRVDVRVRRKEDKTPDEKSLVRETTAAGTKPRVTSSL